LNLLKVAAIQEKTKQQNFFMLRNKEQMTRDMDQICTTVIVSVAIILICLGYVEMSKMKMNSYGSTCGKKAELSDSSLPVSAKAATMTDHKPHMATPTILNTVDGDWTIPVEEDKKCEHEELKQDETELKKFFGEWEADAESTQKYMQASPNQNTAKIASNTRPISVNTEGRMPTNGGRLGLPGLRESIGAGNQKNVQFADSCVEFLQSDSYVSARKINNKACHI
jgi:hypothetical protein